MTTDFASPETAWQNGLAAAREGRHETACRWLDRAHRLAPNDPRIALDLANTRIILGSAGQLVLAAAAFSALTERYDVVPAWLGLLTVSRLMGDHRAATASLTRLLQRHCVPDDRAFPEVAMLIADTAAAPGWCGLSPAGAIQLGILPGAKLRILLNGKPARLMAGSAAPSAGKLDIYVNGAALLGSPLDLGVLRRVEAIVSVVDGSVIGWAATQAAPAAPPHLKLTDAKGAEKSILFGNILPPDEAAPFVRRHSFALPANMLRGLAPPYHFTGPDGADLPGSPVDPLALAAITPIPAAITGPPVTATPRPTRLAIVIPVYRSFAATEACLNAVFAAAPRQTDIIVVDDASPESELSAWLDRLAEMGKISLIRHARNLGFPEAANAGMRAAPGHDILLLNSDTLVPPGAIQALSAAAYSAPDIGSATPFSNDATILSYPKLADKNQMPDLAGAAGLQNLAGEANGAHTVEIPTAIGFCMFMRHDCLEKTGLFTSKIFAQGYGEENDWCLRARHKGFRHVAALGAYVAHQGSVSFGAAGRALAARNARILNALHPGYDALIAKFMKADPLRDGRRRFDIARFYAGKGGTKGAVLLISHNHGGGVARKIASDMLAIRASGRRPLLLIPAAPEDPKNTPFPWDAQLTDNKPDSYPALRFTLPDETPGLLNLLRSENIQSVALHHALGHHAGVRGLAAALGVPQDIILHDYASFCPRVNLLSRAGADTPLRYCGEPNLAGCVSCVAALGDETFEGLGPEQLVERSKQEFAAARHIAAPSADAAQRIARHFPGVRPQITPWEDDAKLMTLKPPAKGRRRIIIIGGIGPAKGFDILIDCAMEARQRNLPLEFIVAGASAEDGELMQEGVFVTGAYAEGEASALVQSLNGDLAFLPSIWPETWCFALSEAWRAGLYAMAFDLGAQGSRIRATGRGAVLPLGLPAPRINDALLAWMP